MKLVFRNFSNLDGDTLDCDYAVLDVTRELVDRVRGLVNVTEGISGLAHATFWDGSADYYEYDEELEESIGEAMDHNGCAPMPDYPPLREPRRTELHQLVVFADGSFCWEAYPKHADVRLTTERIDLKTLEKYL